MLKTTTRLSTELVVGVSAGFHDAAIAVLRGPDIVFANHAERYSRKKNDAFLNAELVTAAVGLDHPCTVAFYENPYSKWCRMLYAGQKPVLYGAKQVGREYFGYPGTRLKNYGHHLSHAAAGFQTAPFDRSIVVVVDAIGEWDTATIWLADYDGNGEACYKKLWSLRYPNSLGLFYSAMTAHVGLKPNEDEYILMGMAAYASPINQFDREFFDQLQTKVNWHAGTGQHLAQFPDMTGYGVAAETQYTLEVKLLEIFALAEKFAVEHNVSNLVYSGGVALNCSANPRVIDAAFWQNVWIMPNPGDAGSALGAAALAYGKKLNWQGPYLGTAIGSSYPVRPLLDYLLQHKIAGVAAGRSEFGPRALGNRSLLADPRGSEIKGLVNKIKHRQQFRPFAPVILEEHANKYFDMSAVPGGRSDYMQYTVPCLYPEQFPAIVHVDNTSRVQTVPVDCKSGIRALLEEWFLATGCPMLLNTSLNIKGQPMVESVHDAYQFERRYGVRVFLGET